jgi:Mannosyltransferase (PIG-V)
MKAALRSILILWAGWFILLYAFQALVSARLQVVRPDYAVEWSAHETGALSNQGKIYLNEPFLNNQVAWDSEYYLGIAVGGYDDPKAGTVTDPANGHQVIKNYSFFPLYPYFIRVWMIPLSLFGMNPIATASLAGVIVSLLGTLAGMAALWAMTRDLFEEETAFRAIFYLLIFPTGFFLAQVYSEGMFIGLAFWSLALSRNKKWLGASVLALLAAWTRPFGAALALPLGIAAVGAIDWRAPLLEQLNGKRCAQLGCTALPLIGYWIWRTSKLGQGWAELQTFLFARGFLSIGASISAWEHALFAYAPTTSQAAVYFGIELASILVALAGAVWLIKRAPELGLYSLVVIVLSVFSGSAQSMARYMLITPAMYMLLGRLGRSKSFDRLWSMASLLLMGLLVMLFTFDMWVG